MFFYKIQIEQNFIKNLYLTNQFGLHQETSLNEGEKLSDFNDDTVLNRIEKQLNKKRC